jgi:hypothetical protein
MRDGKDFVRLSVQISPNPQHCNERYVSGFAAVTVFLFMLAPTTSLAIFRRAGALKEAT